MSLNKPQNESLNKPTTDIGLLEARANHLRMMEKFGIQSIVRSVRVFSPTCNIYRCDNLLWNSKPSEYEFPITFIEGQAVFEGDVVYRKSDGMEVWLHLGFYGYSERQLTLTKPAPVDPLAEFRNLPIDTLVYVNHGSEWFARHFACIKDGKVMFWNGGATSKTAHREYLYTAWDNISITRPEGYRHWSDEK